MWLDTNFIVHKIEKINVNLDDVFVVQFPFGNYSGDTANAIYQAFKHCFPENECIVLPCDCNVQICGRQEQSFEPATSEELFRFLNTNDTERIDT